jgi:FtsP/CotA-like multicopper oxidase with cupredoxin domain/cation diffusion facilitator CzcD-associated flavoprotein CzcO
LHEAIVVGGGQAGLALGYFLSQQRRDFLILEAATEPAAAWRERWESLRLFTSARYDSLPGRAFPGHPSHYPGRDEVVAYLTDYAREFDLPVELGRPVRAIRRTDGAYALELEDRTYEAEQVVVATGPFQVPRVPAIAEGLDRAVHQLHSSGYRRPQDIPDGPVLVVGGGNTGFQIAAELSRSHEVHLAVGSRQTPLPQRILGRDLFWYLDRTGLIYKAATSRLGRRLGGRDTLIGSSPRTLRSRYGVTLRGRAVHAAGSIVTFEDGGTLGPRTVIWATGFGVDHSWIDVPVFGPDGRPAHNRGVTESPGFYFLGLMWQHTRGSALLGWVKDDADYLAQKIAVRAKESQMNKTRQFPTDTAGLPEAQASEIVELAEGDTLDLRIAPVTKRIGDATVRMLAYNGSIPGPTIKVKQGSEILVNVINEGDMEATVHWHGLRLDNRYDGTHETQAPIPVGGRFTARVPFPDAGAYWYHPHIRQDYNQEMGLYGNVLVDAADPAYWAPAHREVLLTLDDILLEDGKVAPFSPAVTTHSAMGRFGEVLLVSGETDLALKARRGEVVRFYLTNTANTRVFKVALPEARMKLVGADSGHVEREELVEEVILAPSERVVVDALFHTAGDLILEHRTPDRIYPLAAIRVDDQEAEPALHADFHALRLNQDMVAERERIMPYMAAEPDKALAFIAEMDMEAPEGDGPVVYACPMHPEVVSEEPGSCPQCGMKLLAVATTYTCPMHPAVVSEEPGHCPECGMKLLPSQLVAAAADGHDHHGDSHNGHGHGDEAAGGIEWEDDMVEVNRMTTPENMRWKLVDRETAAENAEIDWTFRVGDQVKIRLLNEMAGDHPMHHPFHVHGAGRFLVLSRDGVPEQNLVWKDTVLLRTGETVDILLDVTHPGRWMAHCHIAEHHESGMMFSFDVEPAEVG